MFCVVCRFARRLLRRTDKTCLKIGLSFVLALIYILIQSELILHERPVQPEANSNGSFEQIREMKFEGNRVFKSNPLIFFHTARLHMPLTYDEDCEITRDADRFEESSAVVFHAKDLPLPLKIEGKRSILRNQAWVYFNMESPANTIKSQKDEMVFNITISPNRKSDIVHPYGHFYKHVQKEEIDFDLESRTKLVALSVSDCGVEYRNKYVHLLQRFVQVDVYGTCSGIFGQRPKCKEGSSVCNKYLQGYKFYLAFESNFCDDYVSEQYWEALDRGNVPVIMAANYDTMIPGSFIDARDFETVRDLANYLKFLNGNNKAYIKYFKWRKEYSLDVIPQNVVRTDIWLPELCELLLKRDWSRNRVVNISEFYGVENNCPEKRYKEILKIMENEE